MEFKVKVDTELKKVYIQYGSFSSIEYDFNDEAEMGEIIQEFYDENKYKYVRWLI